MPLIKICGITEPEVAYQTATLGADFIGMIFHHPSKRYVNLDNAMNIAEKIKHADSKAVAVFVDADVNYMQEVCEKTGINIVQLHGDIARQEQIKLPKYIQRIYVLHIDANGNITNKIDLNKIQLQIDRDFILFDGVHGGSGNVIDLKNVAMLNGLRFFLAGGLNITNVAERINLTHPYAVDISSGVENISGKKDIALIKQFIKQVKEEY